MTEQEASEKLDEILTEMSGRIAEVIAAMEEEIDDGKRAEVIAMDGDDGWYVLWIDDELIGQAEEVPGVAAVETSNFLCNYCTIKIDPRYDPEVVIRNIARMADAKCAKR